jgi:hypothetical protein
MNEVSRAVCYLWPTLNFADIDGSLENLRYDEPLPEGFTPPTQEQIDAAIATMNTPPTPAEKLAASGLTVEDLRTLLGLPPA